jgi:hypothetical protein
VSRLDAEATVITVTARTIRVRDVILIGGQPRRVVTMRAVHGGTQLRLDSGELLVIGLRQEYTVTRTERPQAWQGRR